MKNNNNNNNKKPSVDKIVANNIKYSARWKFMLISDQAKDLVKNCVEGGGCMSPFQTFSTVSESKKVPCDDLCGESESFTE